MIPTAAGSNRSEQRFVHEGACRWPVADWPVWIFEFPQRGTRSQKNADWFADRSTRRNIYCCGMTMATVHSSFQQGFRVSVTEVQIRRRELLVGHELNNCIKTSLCEAAWVDAMSERQCFTLCFLYTAAYTIMYCNVKQQQGAAHDETGSASAHDRKFSRPETRVNSNPGVYSRIESARWLEVTDSARLYCCCVTIQFSVHENRSKFPLTTRAKIRPSLSLSYHPKAYCTALDLQ